MLLCLLRLVLSPWLLLAWSSPRSVACLMELLFPRRSLSIRLLLVVNETMVHPSLVLGHFGKPPTCTALSWDLILNCACDCVIDSRLAHRSCPMMCWQSPFSATLAEFPRAHALVCTPCATRASFDHWASDIGFLLVTRSLTIRLNDTMPDFVLE